MKYIKKMKWFDLADYKEEEVYLRGQHQNGWKMIELKAPFSIYTFEKCESEDYVYQLDFKQEEQDAEEYIQLFEDCGWEYFYTFNHWYYFRKRKSEIDNENVIFNDAASRAEMAKKVIKFQASIICAAFIPAVIMILNVAANSDFGKRSQVLSLILIIYFIIIAILAVVHIKNFWKLNRLIKKEKEV